VSSLVAATPNAKVLVTSREPLHVESERRYPVEPLRDADAEILFVERGSAVAPAFRQTPAVGEICRRLDGLPLAIELAAARLALLDPEELLARLDRRLPLLAGASRDAPARQRTLRSAIEWSHELLEPDEQQLFRRLAVFAGGFPLDAAETVCDAELDILESLVEKSLVRRWGSGRLGMLDTIREYALERLDESPDGEDMRLRHAEYFLGVAESANLSSDRLPSEGQRHDIAIAAQDNIRAALAWALESGSVALGLQLTTAIENFWVTHDPEEAMALSDRIALMRQGTIEQDGTPSVLYSQPTTAFAARFLGETTAFEGIVRHEQIEMPLGAVSAFGLVDGQAAEAHIRPEHVQVHAVETAPPDAVRGTLRDVRLLGAVTALWIDVPARERGPTTVQALRMGPVPLTPGDEVAVRLDPALALVFRRSR
jgi:hypothetical protein